ncbi:hypothetical protein BABINDRAFT_5836 [Babjeviella inositovora NRRL Y-12698]|uniref:Uncharacterized protein n=1 Tax=Babjeviella inositovora NRRL Y-12698 TaxID=984486 RepID=A0A1E3QZ58_9ASCO|nr:uncharacterized protein BABINDRAFT_5836 [Babjeviella inositovora NRRL Y-12698]ODQ82950.1 hypothetical protein BABINDRAFT_5836 [Babjeviella inositovora NRRL Y-12698]
MNKTSPSYYATRDLLVLSQLVYEVHPAEIDSAHMEIITRRWETTLATQLSVNQGLYPETGFAVSPEEVAQLYLNLLDEYKISMVQEEPEILEPTKPKQKKAQKVSYTELLANQLYAKRLQEIDEALEVETETFNAELKKLQAIVGE